jgi:MFS family permease
VGETVRRSKEVDDVGGSRAAKSRAKGVDRPRRNRSATGITLSTIVSGRSIARTGRYKRFPVSGLALMTGALALLAVVTAQRSQVVTGIGLALFGLGFGMVTQVLVVAVQNHVDRRELGVATASTGFFRALGGAVGAAVLGAVFAAQAGAPASEGAGAGVVDGV